MNVRESIMELTSGDEDLIFLSGFDGAIVGTAISNGNTVVCYSVQKMVDALMQDHDMSVDEALDWLDHNTLFAYFGTHTPVYINDFAGNKMKQENEYYKKQWERTHAEKAREYEIKGFNMAVEALRLWTGPGEEPIPTPYELAQWLEKNREGIMKGLV